MTGPEHYEYAEHLLDAADSYEADGAPQTAASRRAEAQVHATLALAAATLAAAFMPEGADTEAWTAIVGNAAEGGAR